MFSSIGTNDSSIDGPLIILASEEGIQRLAVANVWIAGGTFKKCPKMFQQLVCALDF